MNSVQDSVKLNDTLSLAYAYGTFLNTTKEQIKLDSTTMMGNLTSAVFTRATKGIGNALP